jgi:hypothetical protein
MKSLSVSSEMRARVSSEMSVSVCGYKCGSMNRSEGTHGQTNGRASNVRTSEVQIASRLDVRRTPDADCPPRPWDLGPT